MAGEQREKAQHSRFNPATPIQKSMKLLVRTEESIERIAETVGYGTGFALSKAFKRIAGVSPQHYRLQATG